MSFSILYVTCRDHQEAERISSELLGLRMIACVNILPIESRFWWNSQIDEENEYVALLKTRTELVEAVEKKILAIHSYQTPCIMRWQVSANKEYEEWIHAETDYVPAKK